MKIERTRRGARIIEDDVVLSEILARPGPTHSLFDVLAAAVVAFAPGPRFAMLGFAGGGMIAPLRALRWDHPVRAVDLSDEAESLFRELSDDWAGDVTLDKSDADHWLRSHRGKLDVVVEDLSVPSPAGTVKPYVSFDTLPDRIFSRLQPKGVAVINLLPLPGTEWDALYARVSGPYRRAIAVHLTEYENRVLIAGDTIPNARETGRQLRSLLGKLGSDMLRQANLRTIRYD